ncbi:contractile injection system protein, VgrG/Pvc8 family [Pseudomonas sp. NPDC090202]|uniref:contractile injection system protein, VgrG/Pvc8 family n=1 Tax=unclassified Pseudomonas TaxID=196821 RepID=UPI0038280000
MHRFARATQLRLDVQQPACTLEVLSCTGSEAVSHPYSFELQVVSTQGELDAHDLLFSTGYLHGGGSAPGVHGHIHSIVRSRAIPSPRPLSGGTPVHYLIIFGPRLGMMGYRYNRRFFQDMSAEQIVARLLLEHGIDDSLYRWQRREPSRKRDYCAQYHESDLQLLQRLCVEEGMRYYFIHSRRRHVVVFTDDVGCLPGGMVGTEPDALPAQEPMGLQRACVAGRLFDIAELDDKGRLQVRFDWGNQGDGARFNDCWIALDPHLSEVQPQWWGGMEVLVSFIDDDPDRPLIIDSLIDPDINPRTDDAEVKPRRRVITTRIDPVEFLDGSQQFHINDQWLVHLSEHNELRFRVGDSEVTIDANSVTLSGLAIMLSALEDDRLAS